MGRGGSAGGGVGGEFSHGPFIEIRLFVETCYKIHIQEIRLFVETCYKIHIQEIRHTLQKLDFYCFCVTSNKKHTT